jgi:UDP-glucose:(heptosyl)LPS alpha-1,3-glucosyltransferase
MVVVDLLDVKRVGSERRYTELIRGLRAAGHEIHLFARGWDAAAAAGLRCHRVVVPGPAALRPLTFALAAGLATRRWRGRLDLIHSHTKSLGDDVVSPGGSAHRAWVRLLASEARPLRRRALPWHPYHLSSMAVERVQLARARRVVVNSEWSRRTLVDAYPEVGGRLEIVRNGVDADAFTPALRKALREPMRARLGLEAGECCFLFVGAGDRRKGLVELLEAFAPMRAAARLVVVGHRDAREAARVDAAIARLGLASRVVLTGFAADPRPFYAAADAFVLATRFDPFSNATAEALACGLPVLTTRANGVSELLTDGREGFVVADARDRVALADALTALLDPARRRAMGDAARALAEQWPWRRHVAGTLAVYEALGR